MNIDSDGPRMPKYLKFNAGEYFGLSSEGRALVCLELAAEAMKLAEEATAVEKAAYLEIARQWRVLAHDMRTPNDNVNNSGTASRG